MLIAIDAGHGRYTPGKRCLKSIDPNETREWVLNSRIADKVQALLSLYDCQTMRVDDTTGETDISEAGRVKAANSAKADFYISIHHNAGINGGAGGGIVVFAARKAADISYQLQDAVYRYTVAATGLKGNRSNPKPVKDFYVLRNTNMPAILGEYGFMDSTYDTPIILKEAFADKTAAGIVSALVEVLGLEATMNEEKIRAIVREEYAKIQAELAALGPSDWAVPYIDAAIDKGCFAAVNGSIERPQGYITREEVAAVVSHLKAE